MVCSTLRIRSWLVLATLLLPIPAFATPVQHIVLFQFKDDTSAAAIERVVEDFEELSTKIPGISGFQWGTDNSPEGLQRGFTHAFIITFEDAAARDAYLPHPAHQAFVESALPLVESVHAFDFQADPPRRPFAPGRVHHLVFFDYKDEATREQIREVADAFAALRRQIPGLLHYQAGPNTFPDPAKSNGFDWGFQVTFIHQDARDDYLPHPKHRDFVEILSPILENVLVVDFTVRPSGRSLLVTSGLEPYRVYQRDANDRATLRFKGLAAGDGPIEARVLSGRRVVEGLDWRKVGKAAAGRFEAELQGVPTGGAYTVEIRRRDALGNVAEITDVADILVGDIWVLAGQSNMQGVGDLENMATPHPLVHAFTMAHRWELAVEPLHWLIDSRDPVHYGAQLDDLDEAGRRAKRSEWRQQRRKGAGLGLPFAREMVRRTGVPVGLITAAHGGTSMSQWNPALKERGGESLYGSMLKQVRRAGGEVRGVLWYQGESDANERAAPLYAERFQKLVSAVREDFGDDDLPFYYVQIGRFVIDRHNPHWKAIQETQRALATEISNTAVVSVIDLPLDDLIHVGTAGLKRLGARLARVACRKLFGHEHLEIGPRLRRAVVAEGGTSVRVEYDHVNGSLQPAKHIAGFSIDDPEGKPLDLIFSASVDPSRPESVILKLRSPVPDGARLWYGAGLDPYCNLVDSEDMAALAIGPVRLK